jgi:hypothetical protein
MKTATVKTTEATETHAQPTASAEFSLLGSLGVAFSESTYVLTCGGPKVGIKYGDFFFRRALSESPI